MLSTQQHTNYPLRRLLKTTSGTWALAVIGAFITMAVFYFSVTALRVSDSHSARMALAYLPPIAVTLVLIASTGLVRSLGLSQPSPLKLYFTPAWYHPLIALILMALNLLGAAGKEFNHPSFSALFYVLLTNLLVGVFEELLCRGFIFNVLQHQAQRAGRSVWWAISCSSVIFGLLHFFNLVGQPQLKIATIGQVFYAILAGMILGTVYYLSGSIWVVIIIHATVDFLISFGELLAPPAASQGVIPDATISTALLQVLILVPGVWLAWRAIRKHADSINQAS